MTNEITVLKVYKNDVKSLLDHEDINRFHSMFALFRSKIIDVENFDTSNLSADVSRMRAEALKEANDEKDRINTILSYAARLNNQGWGDSRV